MASHIGRRKFLATLGGAAAVAWPIAARGQQPTMPVIGWLGSESRESERVRVISFRQGLKEAGYVGGQNVAIEYRLADGQYDRLPALAADLVRRRVAVIALTGLPAALAAKAATTSIPIVFEIADDPVQLGLIASLNRPGGNLTGLTSLNVETVPKQFELLHELIPTATSIALLVNPASPSRTESTTRDGQIAARRLGLKLHVLHASSERDFDTPFATFAQLQAGALVIGADSFFFGRVEQLATLALRLAVPASYPYREFAAAGGLVSYGTNLPDLYRQVGVYAGRILNGEKPAGLPVLQPTKFDLVINLKTAKALGLTVLDKLLVAADEVIE
jgi:putative tryptophan/tyrosine transport system substrate-binding protein